MPRPDPIDQGSTPQGIEPDVSYTKMDGIGAPSNQHEVLIRHARDLEYLDRTLPLAGDRR